MFAEEIQLLQQLEHVNIVRVLGASRGMLPSNGSHDEKPASQLCMLLEYLDMGDLQTFLKKKDGTLPLNSLIWFSSADPGTVICVCAAHFTNYDEFVYFHKP
ncbi:hypothetical protein SARC_15592 [Sphaeroforma arctica JP610]|uniref:Protein kinase domain-containing protein n=1 Tax=Sphaeroforma arctica JP610 TaxID=667725 RepID=A0A0L0F6T2_9EUKA|nr:hypothetical protein SARC_15592 [Sphaeroforma arctica JP610]KNC71863.1 hypothetical protein SARC_15592 [Sphaeroforma arctica JP610]|eukprot:XP_014145765.1 hypothetical protein SARC_15592 [Sphaeroforma arctica JP610]